MMTKCLVCGSTEIIPDLKVFTQIGSERDTTFVSLEHPKGKGAPVEIGFRVAICGECGHVEFHTRHAAELLEAHKKGYTSPK
ncbi:MAG: hypothetical protein ACOY0R_12250 [Chloroflexota bacterium]